MTGSEYRKRKGVLAIGAHPDDIELGCGATLAHLVRKGLYVVAVVMTSGQAGAAASVDRHEESRHALKILGCQQIIHLSYPDTCAHTELNNMISTLEDILKNRSPPDVDIIRVYTMHAADRHQDHVAVYKASVVACRSVPQILGYETPSVWISFMPQVFGAVDEECFSIKLAALREHKSQCQRDYMSQDRLRTIAQFRGQQVGQDLCEGFVIHKMIL